MPNRRPRCTCGDLYSEHDMRSQNTSITDPCRGPVCSTLLKRGADLCDDYQPEGTVYVPLAQVLPQFGLQQGDLS